jgi:hypothetical protein
MARRAGTLRGGRRAIEQTILPGPATARSEAVGGAEVIRKPLRLSASTVRSSTPQRISLAPTINPSQPGSPGTSWAGSRMGRSEAERIGRMC